MKVFTKNEFSGKQRLALMLMANTPIESEMDRQAVRAYWQSITSSIDEQLADVGGAWDVVDLQLLDRVGQRIIDTQGVGRELRMSITAALWQATEVHPMLGLINPDFIE